MFDIIKILFAYSALSCIRCASIGGRAARQICWFQFCSASNTGYRESITRTHEHLLHVAVGEELERRAEMRHRWGFKRLGRDIRHRKALLKNLATALIKHERIVTTLAKAKELRRVGDRVSGYCASFGISLNTLLEIPCFR